MPVAEETITSRTARVPPIGWKFFITAGWIRFLSCPVTIALKLLRWMKSLSTSHAVPGARLSANRTARRRPSDRLAPFSPSAPVGLERAPLPTTDTLDVDMADILGVIAPYETRGNLTSPSGWEPGNKCWHSIGNNDPWCLAHMGGRVHHCFYRPARGFGFCWNLNFSGPSQQFCKDRPHPVGGIQQALRMWSGQLLGLPHKATDIANKVFCKSQRYASGYTFKGAVYIHFVPPKP